MTKRDEQKMTKEVIKCLNRVSVFIAGSEKDPELKKFWQEVQNELLHNI